MKPVQTPFARYSRFLPAIIFSLLLIGAVGAYSLNVFVNARSGEDWVMILPVAVICISALLLGLREDVRASVVETTQKAKDSGVAPTIAFMAALIGYVALIPYIGIEIATMAFLALSLFIHGERRPSVLVSISIIGGGAVVWCFVRLFSVSMPTMFL